MVRPYGIKVNKRKHRQEKYDKEKEEAKGQKVEEEVEEEEPVKKAKTEKTMDTTEKTTDTDEDGEEREDSKANELEGIPIAPSSQKLKESSVVFVLEKASLEVAKVGKTYQLLNSDDHANFLRKNNKNPGDYRPDIVHQALLMILDSPVNKAGRLKAVYVRTEKGVLIEVKPHVRIPRTFKRFAGVMLQLLQKLHITATDKREKLLRVIKNPVTQYLPVNSRKIGFSVSSEKLVNMQKHLSAVGNGVDFVFVVGAMAHGKVETDYTEDFVAISGYPLSAAYCISRICEALSTNWNII